MSDRAELSGGFQTPTPKLAARTRCDTVMAAARELHLFAIGLWLGVGGWGFNEMLLSS
jgi:hypothetical protein